MSTAQSRQAAAPSSPGESSTPVPDDLLQVINKEPGPTEGMDESPNKEYEGRSSYTLSETGSGYERDDNECVEFCLDFCTCFGTFDTCCPSTGEGCLSSTATFIGNLIFGCCKC